MLTTRIVAGNDSAFSYVRLKYGSNLTDTVTGVIIYPDDFSFAEAGVGALNFGANYAITQIDAATWEALEDMGCVFLPLQPRMYYSGDLPIMPEADAGRFFHYWTSTANNASASNAVFFQASPGQINPARSIVRYVGFSVRLAQDL